MSTDVHTWLNCNLDYDLRMPKASVQASVISYLQHDAQRHQIIEQTKAFENAAICKLEHGHARW